MIKYKSLVLISGLLILFSACQGQETTDKPLPIVPQEQDLQWIKANAIPIKTADPIDDNSDLMPLKKMIGDRHLVALGEGTHGTSEFFKMKHRLTKFLAREMGFTLFAIEANMPEARQVNRYVLTGEGDPHKALAGLYFWTWDTSEVLEMIKWMREYNRSGQGKIEFYGFDMQTPTMAMDCVTQFVKKADKNFLKTTSENYKQVADIHKQCKQSKDFDCSHINFQVWYDAAKEVYDHLMAQKETYLKSYDSLEVDWAIRDALVVLQGAESNMKGKRSRDQSMADNLDWIIKHQPAGTKIITWAHNGHVSKSHPKLISMGSFLDQRYGDDMMVFAFAFHKGDYTAKDKNDIMDDTSIDTFSTSQSGPGSAEWFFKCSGIPMFILDIRPALQGEPGAQWLNRELEFRSIGAVASDHAFSPRNLPEEFDAIVFFENTTPSLCFRSKARSGNALPESETWWQVELRLRVSGEYTYQTNPQGFTGNFSFTAQVLGTMLEDEGDFIFVQAYEKISNMTWKENIYKEKKQLNLSKKIKPGITLNYVFRRNGQLSFDFEIGSIAVPAQPSILANLAKHLHLPESAGDKTVKSNQHYNKGILQGSNQVQVAVQDIYNKKELNRVFKWKWQEKDTSPGWYSSHDVEALLKIIRLKKE